MIVVVGILVNIACVVPIVIDVCDCQMTVDGSKIALKHCDV